MKINLFIPFFYFLILGIKLQAQDSTCTTKQFYRISSIGNEEEMFPYFLNFNIKGDSITITSTMSSDLNTKGNLLFTILSKKCVWKKKFIEGEAMYDVMINQEGQIRNGYIKITIDENKKGKIVLRYSDKDELRVLGFTLQ